MDLRQFDLNLLVTFDAVMSAGSVTGAAERLGLSTAAISQGLTRLKSQLNDPLFIRQGRGIVPTQAAQNLHQQVVEALKLLDQALTPAAEFDPCRSTRTFVLAGPSYLDLALFPGFQQRKEAEGWQLSLALQPHDDDPAQLVQQLCDRQVDLFIGTISSPHPSIQKAPLLEEEMVVAVAQHHPRITDQLSFADYFAEQHSALRNRRLNMMFVSSLVQQTIPVRQIAYQSDSLLHMLHTTSQTALLCTCPATLARHWAPILGLKLFPLPFDCAPIRAQLNWHRNSAADPGLMWLKTLLAELVTPGEPSQSECSFVHSNLVAP